MGTVLGCVFIKFFLEAVQEIILVLIKVFDILFGKDDNKVRNKKI